MSFKLYFENQNTLTLTPQEETLMDGIAQNLKSKIDKLTLFKDSPIYGGEGWGIKLDEVRDKYVPNSETTSELRHYINYVSTAFIKILFPQQNLDKYHLDDIVRNFLFLMPYQDYGMVLKIKEYLNVKKELNTGIDFSPWSYPINDNTPLESIKKVLSLCFLKLISETLNGKLYSSIDMKDRKEYDFWREYVKMRDLKPQSKKVFGGMIDEL